MTATSPVLWHTEWAKTIILHTTTRVPEEATISFFIRLKTPGHKGIGIHGTHLPESIGEKTTEGCIRLRNEDLKRLVSLIYPPLTVIITPSAEDEKHNITDIIHKIN